MHDRELMSVFSYLNRFKYRMIFFYIIFYFLILINSINLIQLNLMIKVKGLNWFGLYVFI